MVDQIIVYEMALEVLQQTKESYIVVDQMAVSQMKIDQLAL